MNKNRQYASRQPVQRLDGRQVTRSTRQDDERSDVVVEENEEDGYDDKWPPRLASSARKYQLLPLQGQRVRYELQPKIVHTTIPPRRSAQTQTGTRERRTEQPQTGSPKRKRRRWHPLWYLGIGMIVMLALWVTTLTVVTWAENKLNDMTYGYPRTWQTDAVVGHNGDSVANPSHFVFLNLNGHVEIFELPGGDASKAKIYYGPTLYSDNASLIPVTGEFRDVNGDGKPDMIVHIQNSRIVFINENGQFRPMKPGEHVTL
ncbi:MAG: hypothetical protein ABI396_19220 [Ktedonobacteraceae bacterium]